MYKLIYTSQSQKDAKKINQNRLKLKVEKLLEIIKINPFQNPPYYEKLIGYDNRYSRRINRQHRITYEVFEDKIKILRMWTHYE